MCKFFLNYNLEPLSMCITNLINFVLFSYDSMRARVYCSCVYVCIRVWLRLQSAFITEYLALRTPVSEWKCYHSKSKDMWFIADVDECSQTPSICGSEAVNCSDTYGSYICYCKNGTVIRNGTCILMGKRMWASLLFDCDFHYFCNFLLKISRALCRTPNESMV